MLTVNGEVFVVADGKLNLPRVKSRTEVKEQKQCALRSPRACCHYCTMTVCVLEN